MSIEIISQPITIEKIRQQAAATFGDMVKIVVDLDKKIMAIGGELHADEEAVLLENGSQQANLWGANIYPDQPRETWLEYNSMINIRPSAGNRSRDIQDARIQQQVKAVVDLLVN